jgi:ssDNA-binding Zn-finger/Zn-ribbon topoisomerase 1
MKSFTFPLTTPQGLLLKIAEIQEGTEKWAKQQAAVEDQPCPDCGKPMQKLIDAINGIEWICNC